MSDSDVVTGAKSDVDIGVVFEEFIAAVHQLENALTGTRLIFAEGDLSVGDWVVLRNIPTQEDIRLPMLARRTGLSRQRLNKLLEGLSESGLVKVRQESEDKRVRLVSITASGTRELGKISTQMHGVALKTVGNAKPEMLQRFATVAKRIINTMAPKPQKDAAQGD